MNLEFIETMKPYRLLMLLVVAVTAGACDALLEVDDLGSIQEGQLEDPATEELIMNGILSEFQYGYSYLTLSTGILSDEIYTDHTNIDVRNFSIRDFGNDNALNNNTYTFLHKIRAAADDGYERLLSYHEGEANQNLNVARARMYGGYAYVFLGENFCASPVDGSEAFNSDELLTMAIERFEEAINVAEASGQAGAEVSEVERVINLSNLGIARASLQLGELNNAVTYAQEVPESFEAWVYRSENSSREENQWERPGRLEDPWASVGLRFLNLEDPRIRHTEEAQLGLNAEEIYPPYLPYSYEGWDPQASEQSITRSTDIRFASGLEAQYIIAEAEGPTDDTRTFVNERRAVGGQDPVDYTGDELMEELREQRARDFYLTGHRIADLRRYKDQYGVDLYPSGDYPIGGQVYGDVECFMISQDEVNSNPNL